MGAVRGVSPFALVVTEHGRGSGGQVVHPKNRFRHCQEIQLPEGQGEGVTMIEKGGELLLGDGVVVRGVVHVEDEVNFLIKGSSAEGERGKS
jgi:hypothetical protein